eukprot:TRINITY_DN23044_c0_g1_i1.p1 TRINITY_DN23044_c0_g1~~TRINITY_DN23044_c0_g1_i1.p1  ORF type:complete len:80 (+),score=34.02 TRINITY_DN23044_c0_g1_i1:45-284(+)
MTKPEKNERLDRHSGSGLRGLPKKNGYGGWGNNSIENEEEAPAALDPRDPNYDDGEEEIVTVSADASDESPASVSSSTA